MPGNIWGRFCQIKPLSLLEKRIIGLVDEDDCVDIIHLDFSKAFDLAPHDILVKSLHYMKLTEHILDGLRISLWHISEGGC